MLVLLLVLLSPLPAMSESLSASALSTSTTRTVVPLTTRSLATRRCARRLEMKCCIEISCIGRPSDVFIEKKSTAPAIAPASSPRCHCGGPSPPPPEKKLAPRDEEAEPPPLSEEEEEEEGGLARRLPPLSEAEEEAFFSCAFFGFRFGKKASNAPADGLFGGWEQRARVRTTRVGMPWRSVESWASGRLLVRSERARSIADDVEKVPQNFPSFTARRRVKFASRRAQPRKAIVTVGAAQGRL